MAIVSRLLTVTQGNIDNSHLYLTDVMDIFPADVLDGEDETRAAPRTVRVQWGGDAVDTDIDRSKNIFRRRGWVGQFFREARVQAGDRVLLEQLDPYQYRVSRAKEAA
jgi:DNA polymerase III subunit epsilon